MVSGALFFFLERERVDTMCMPLWSTPPKSRISKKNCVIPCALLTAAEKKKKKMKL